MPQEVILASQSPRRAELLTRMGVEFEVIPSGFNEQLDDTRPPEEVAAELALGKAMDVAYSHPDAVVIGSDTIVAHAGKQLGKPCDKAEALQMLRGLSGAASGISTGLAVVCLSRNISLVGVDTAEVVFKPYDEQAVVRYVETGDPLDKAGAYGIQSGAAPLVSHIIGDYDTVVGLPTKLLEKFLSQVGIAARQVDLEITVEQRC